MSLANAPVQYPELGFGPYGAIPNEVADYAYGPENLGVPDWPFQYFTRWIGWKASDGVRVAKWVPGFVPSDTAGQLSDLFDGDTNFSDLSIAFDQNGRLVVAVQRGEDAVEVRRRQAGDLTIFTWAGKSPVLFFNGELEYQTPLTDVVCYYLPADGDRILVRVQRENFSTEHVMHASLPIVVGHLTKADRVVHRSYLWGMSAGERRRDVRQLVFKSQLYDPWPVLVLEVADVSVEFESGDYFLAVVEADTVSDAGSIALEFESGVYLSAVVTVDDQFDAASLALDFDSGVYLDAVVSASIDLEKGQLTLGFESGNYIEVVRPINIDDDKSALGLDFVSGSYV
jgi:hypothetical protein